MALQCNIDSRGRVARLVYGVVLMGAGSLAAWLWAAQTGSAWAWVVSVATIAGGAFAIFEARAGWCALRAMGIKTPL